MPEHYIPVRRLGNSGPDIPALGFGLMGLSLETYGRIPPDEERFKVLDRAYELGETFWDTSDLYGDGETLLGKWFDRTGKRPEIFLATKFGFIKGSRTLELDTSGEYCKKACEESLEALGVDCIDLYYMHHADPKTPIEETMRALAELQAEGKIKYIGLSTVSSATLRRAVKIAHVDAVQFEYSPFVLDAEGAEGTNLIATCRELGVAIVAATPLGRGLLTSNFASGEEISDDKDIRPKFMPRFQEANRGHNVKLAAEWQALAEKKGCTAAQLSLAWLLKQGEDIFPIPGTKKIKNLEENWASLKVQLTAEDESEVRRFMEANDVAGPYIPPKFKSFLFRDTAEET